MSGPPDESIRSVSNALRIIDVVAEMQPVGVTQLARRLEMPKTSVHRMLRTLQHTGWIRTADAEGVRWELTSHLLGISLKAFGEYTLIDFAAAALADLRSRTGETVYLVALDADTGLVVDRADGVHPIRAYVELGTRLELAATGTGLAVLAHVPRAKLDALLDRVDAVSQLPVDRAKLEFELRTVREFGYAVKRGEWRGSIAAPILGADGAPVGALSIAIPLSRFEESPIERFGAWIRAACAGIGPVPPGRIVDRTR